MWFFKSKKQEGDVTEERTALESKEERPILEDRNLEQLKPLKNETKQGDKQHSVSDELRSLTAKDFAFTNLITIPCFRDAGLAGFTCLFVFSTVMFAYHKNIRRAANWGFGGLMLGSVFGWEQCNATRRKGQEAVRLAQERFESKSMGGKKV